MEVFCITFLLAFEIRTAIFENTMLERVSSRGVGIKG